MTPSGIMSIIAYLLILSSLTKLYTVYTEEQVDTEKRMQNLALILDSLIGIIAAILLY